MTEKEITAMLLEKIEREAYQVERYTHLYITAARTEEEAKNFHSLAIMADGAEVELLDVLAKMGHGTEALARMRRGTKKAHDERVKSA